MSAPSPHTPKLAARLRARPGMSRVWVLLIATCVALAACRAGGNTDGSLDAVASMGSMPESDCRPAPAWLAARVEETLAVREAALTRLFVGPATNLSGGSAEVRSEVFRSAWWVAALIGVGARPEVGIWLVSGLKQGDSSLRIVPADEVALRYSATDQGSEPILGEGREAVRSCVGTPPEP
jgi:hypothetical protein